MVSVERLSEHCKGLVGRWVVADRRWYVRSGEAREKLRKAKECQGIAETGKAR